MSRFVLCLIAMLLAACGTVSPLSKTAPQPVADDSLIHPPWEALVKAGPGAENDVDLETLNGPGAGPPVPGLRSSAPGAAPADGASHSVQTAQAAPAVPADATSDLTKPEQPARPVLKGDAVAIKAVAVVMVMGLPHSSADELTVAMRKVLKDAGWPVLEKPRADALTIQGQVKLDPAAGANQGIHIDWRISTPKGKVLGDVNQDNQVPAHSLDGAWGKTADYAAQAAADGIYKLINQYR